MKPKTIGILTGGGDVPGLNPALKALIYRAVEDGHRVIGIRRGWDGLLQVNCADPASVEKHTMSLDRQAVRTVDRAGGTFLHTSRVNPASVGNADVPAFLRPANHAPNVDSAEKNRFCHSELGSESPCPRVEEMPNRVRHDAQGALSAESNVKTKRDFTAHVLANLQKLGIDVLIPIGGDDTLSYAERLDREGFAVIAIPKTMDNDVYGTDYCIGFSTAVTRSVNFIHNLRTCAGSHERIAVVELFGRNSGETALVSSYLSGVDRTVISEVPFDMERLSRLLTRDKQANPSNYAMLTVSEGACMIGDRIIESGDEDAYGHKKLGGMGFIISEGIKKLTGLGTIYQPLSYLMRSGVPDSLDLMVAFNYANMAVDLVSEGAKGRMVALRAGSYSHVPIATVMSGKKRVDIAELYDVDEYRPKIRHLLGKPMFLY